MHICQDEVVVIGWAHEQFKVCWAYVAHTLNWLRRRV